MPTIEIPSAPAPVGDDTTESTLVLADADTETSPRTEQNSASPRFLGGEAASPRTISTYGATTECVICLSALSCTECGPVCVLTRSGQRVCKHFYHMHCAQRIKSVDGKGYGERVQTFYTDSVVKTCPNCRADFDGVREVPNPKTKPRDWFSVMDFKAKGRMDQEEFSNYLLTCLDVDCNQLSEFLHASWHKWEPTPDCGFITKDVIMDVMLAVNKQFPPFLPEDPIGWFETFDTDRTGELTKAQVARGVACTLQSGEDEARDLVESVWNLLVADKKQTITKAEFLEPRGLSHTLCASLADDPRFTDRVEQALMSPKNRSAFVDPCKPAVELEVGMRVRVMAEIGTPRYKWGRICPGDIGVLKSIDKEKNVCRVDFPKQRMWRGYLPELERVPDYLIAYRPWQIGDDAQIIQDLTRAKRQQEDRSNWVSSMDATCGKVGQVVLVLPAERKLKVRLERGMFVYVMENVVRPGMPDPPKFEVGMRVRIKAEVTTPKYQWGNVSPGDIGTVTSVHDVLMTCQVSFPRHHNWKGYQADMEVVGGNDDDSQGAGSEGASGGGSPRDSPLGSPTGVPRVRVGSYIRVKDSVVTPKFAWGRISQGDIGVVVAVERVRELVTVDFPSQRNWIGYLHEMEVVRVRAPTTQWACSACTYLNEAASATCDMCDAAPPYVVDESPQVSPRPRLSGVFESASSNQRLSDAS